VVQIKRTNLNPSSSLVVSLSPSSLRRRFSVCLTLRASVDLVALSFNPHGLFARRSFPTAPDTLRCALHLPSPLPWLLLWLMLKVPLFRRLRSLRQVPFCTILRPWLTIVPTVRELCNQLLWWFWSLLCRWYVSVFPTSL
jgi:hypothetical protein